jgi:RNA polymerase sigma-70 factor (ECF subfamily)
MARLPADQRAVVMLVCVEGQSYKEAADTLAVPIGTVMSRLSRARGVLTRQLGDASPDSSATVVRLKPDGH